MAATAEWEPPVAPEAAPVAQPERKGTAPAPGPPAAINRKAENNQPDEIHYVNPFVHKLVWDDPIDKAKVRGSGKADEMPPASRGLRCGQL